MFDSESDIERYHQAENYYSVSFHTGPSKLCTLWSIPTRELTIFEEKDEDSMN